MNVYLYAPNAALGGTETLALRIAVELHLRGIPVTVITEDNGWLSKNAKQIKIATVSPQLFATLKMRFSHRNVVISSAKYINDVILSAHINYTLFWILHPLEYIWTSYKRIFRFYEYFQSCSCGFILGILSPFLFFRLRNKLHELINYNALISMSEDCNLFTTKFLMSSRKIPILPLPIPVNQISNTFENRSLNIKKIAYFGRIEQFKVASIKRLIKDYASAAEWRRYPLVLFGYGAYESQVSNYAKSLGVSIEITGKIELNQVINRAIAERMLVFTMGLSAIDLLSSNIPVVFLPIPRSGRDSDGNYSFLNQLPEGCLGSYPEFLANFNGHSFQEITDICNNNEKIGLELIKDKSRIIDQHKQSNCVDKLLEFAHLRITINASAF
jgi:hypothetical protein